MKTEILVAWITVIGGLAGVILGLLFGAWTVRRQLSLSYDTLKLELLQKKLERLEAVFEEVSKVSIDLGDPKLAPEQIRSRAIDMFVRQVGAFKLCMHYFPKQLEEDLTGLHADINHCIVEAKMSGSVDEVRAGRVVAAIPVLQKKMLAAISEELRIVQAEISRLISQHH